ncbi:MAG: hypothetical protein ACD_12C00464G0002 [uncultured bacterium]|nr:MAG: hypothetical protein ACD_12C00464G0002 [uncultured bacterium]
MLYLPRHSLTSVEIKKENIIHNIKQFRNIVGPNVKLMAVVKSDAYGHGIVPVAELAQKNGIDYLGVVNLHEALLLKNTQIKLPILILSYFNKEDVAEGIIEGVEFPVYNLEDAKFLSEKASEINKPVNVHVKIDTGTSRLGVFPAQVLDFIHEVSSLSNLGIKGVYTHLADSENFNQTYTKKQVKLFKELLFKIQKRGLKINLKHCACSASTLVDRDYHFDLVRIGISLYGLWASSDNKKLVNKKLPDFTLKPALTWKTKVIQVKVLSKGTSVGYGLTFKTKKKTTLAILPVGYNEGYDRLLSNKGQVLIRGKRAKILGRVCMNMTMVDATHIPNIKVGEEVVLLGRQEKEEITAEEVAQKIGTINYEVVTRINPLLPRIYI